MKIVHSLYAVFLFIPFVAQAQLWLKAGDSYVYEFTNFGLNGNFPGTPAGANLYLGMSGVDGTEGFLLEVFESNTSETPLVTFSDTRFVPNPIVLGSAWADRQGVVRFTVTSGALSVDILFASVVYPNGDVYAAVFDILDADGDGVVDHQDQCPDTTPLVFVDERGCSIAEPDPTIIADTGRHAYSWAARIDQFTGVSWTQTNAYQDVSISAHLYGADAGDSATAYLTTRIGPGTTLADQVAVASITFPASPSTVVLFSDFTLRAGTYYLIITGATNYYSGWGGGDQPNILSDSGVTHNGSFIFNDSGLYPPAAIPGAHSNLFQIFAVRGTRMPPNRPPVAAAGVDQRLECSGPATTVLLDGRDSSDPDGDLLTYTWWEGTTQLGVGPTLNVNLSSGSHNIRLVVMDLSASSAEDTLLVEIQDRTAPIIQVTAYPAVLWPPNGKMVPVTIDANVLDPCDPLASARIVAVESDEPSTRSNDWEITGALTLRLRAQRLGTRHGRTYRVFVEASDLSHNTATTSISIFVPH